jgi:uncharacterized protein
MLPVVHLELHTGDLASARVFYAEQFGWKPALVRSYQALETGSPFGGGIVQCSAPRPLWLPYVEVSDVASATEGARAAGATVLLEPREGPTGWRSVVRTAAAGEIAFWQPKR